MMKLSEIALKVDATFSGEDLEIFALNSLKNANKAELTYCDGEKNAKFINTSNAGAILVTKSLLDLVPDGMVDACVTDNPHLAFAILSKIYANAAFLRAKTIKYRPKRHYNAKCLYRLKRECGRKYDSDGWGIFGR